MVATTGHFTSMAPSNLPPNTPIVTAARRRLRACFAMLLTLALMPLAARGQTFGGIRGMVYDKDFDVPLPGARVTIAENGETTTGGDEGNFVFQSLLPGVYTLVFAKQGYTRQILADVVVAEGGITELEAYLTGEFTEMEEFVVQDIQLGESTEIGLLNLRMESPALLDSISSDLMSAAGAGDAASALKLVAGASVQDGKYAVVRGLPDRYVNSQMNGVRLPSADPDKRAVQLDQFPSALIESIQVSKTFTPDQQGDASGGAVNVVLRSIPEEPVLSFKVGTKFNSATNNEQFLTYHGGGIKTWGKDDGRRAIPEPGQPGAAVAMLMRELPEEKMHRLMRETNVRFFLDPDNDRLLRPGQGPFGFRGGKVDRQGLSAGDGFGGAVGVTRDEPQSNYDWSLTLGGKHEFFERYKIGGLVSAYYKRSASYYEKGRDDSYWVEEPGQPMTPRYGQGSPEQGDFRTALFDVSKGTQEIQWGWLGTVGVESDNHSLSFIYMYNRSTEDSAALTEDVRGKEWYFPGYQASDMGHPGNQNSDAAPYLRNETLEYTERNAETRQWHGRHKLPIPEIGHERYFVLLPPEIDWTVADSSSELYSPDKRQFGSYWLPASITPGFPAYGIPDIFNPAKHQQSKAAANFTLGNLQRIWKDIGEESEQHFINLKFPFRQWSGDVGYLKIGLFNDQVERAYLQSSFSNFNLNAASFSGEWNEYWSAAFPFENHPVTAANVDVSYQGDQKIHAWYYMLDMPLCSFLNVVGGVRYESTELNIVNRAESDVTWIPPGSNVETKLNEGDADVAYEQDDVLPSLGLVLKPFKQLTLRGSYSETVARQTFKELTPIQQMEYLGGEVFIGNPQLGMSALKNYDLRLDWTPYEGGLLSLSWFHKDIVDPIEYVQRLSTFIYTTAVNYPEGELTGYEIELRQQLGQLWGPLRGLTLGANATFIDSQVTLPDDEAEALDQPNINAPMRERDMTNAPEYLYNIYLTYDLERTGTRLGLFYSVQGDTLVAGAGQSNGNYVPNVYAREYGTLNLSVSQAIGNYITLTFQAKNLTNPAIREVYRSDYVDGDVEKNSYKKGLEYSIAISGRF